MRNKFGLTRDIPEGIKRQVRQRDGFGCVVCGNAIIEYEHFAPEFVDAEEHSVDGIVLLCPRCHNKKKRGFLSRETIRDHISHPKAKELGFSFDEFDIGSDGVSVLIGNVRMNNVLNLIKIFNENVIRIDPPEERGGPFQISANIYDGKGNKILIIDRNHWRSTTSNWDVDVSGGKIIIRSDIREIELILRNNNRGTLIFERMRFQHRGVSIDAIPGKETTFYFEGKTFKTSGMEIEGAIIGIEFTERGTSIAIGAMHTKVASLQVINDYIRDKIPPKSHPRSADILPLIASTEYSSNKSRGNGRSSAEIIQFPRTSK